MTREQLTKVYDIVFSDVHSIGFKASEAKSLLFDNTYWFLQKPKENWYDDLIKYLEEINFNKAELNMNQNIIKYLWRIKATEIDSKMNTI